jgi:diguanylate cyclase (GGDEF)-like protein
MHLDLMTMSAVDITLTAILAAVLLFTWARDAREPEGGPRFVGWWGLAMLIQSMGVVIALAAALQNNNDLITIGTATMVLADALKWNAAREFAGRSIRPLWVFLGPAGFFFIAHSGLIDSFDGRLILVCAVLAAYDIAAAVELGRVGDHQLVTHWPAVTLIIATAVTYLTWVPLIVTTPLHQAGAVFTSHWFPTIVLVTVLIRVALAFIVLSMAKERQEREQRLDALTDSLTGLPNRRALFEAADAVGQRRILGGTPVSVLIFDLDHFKDTNDSYGHDLGDEVLKVFAKTVAKHLNVTSIVGRLGGEEFAAILPGADAAEAVLVAESVRCAFARAAAFVNGLAVGATVSIGVASDVIVETDLAGLFRRADAALYVAKRAGRDKVALLESEDDSIMPGSSSTIRTSPTRVHPSPAVTPRPAVRIT